MVDLSKSASATTLTSNLLFPGEFVAVVDDSPEIVLLLSHYLSRLGFKTIQAASAKELFKIIDSHNIALILLDIGLPDRNGDEILNDLVPAYPDLGIIMVTGTTDIQVALDCLRHGADDYLTKPVSLKLFQHTVKNTLKKRRLAINNRLFQEELENTNSQMRFLHHLNLKINSAYLNTGELRGVLLTILCGITAIDGLCFDRAALALFTQNGEILRGKLAIGPANEGGNGTMPKITESNKLRLSELLHSISIDEQEPDITFNKSIESLQVNVTSRDNILIHAANNKKLIYVKNGFSPECPVSHDLLRQLGTDSFVVIPLFSPSRSLGVIIVDNLVSNNPISSHDILGLEIFASQASLAIEHSHLYTEMEKQIGELELVTEQLEKNKDLLIEAERTATIGNVSAQLLHTIRNPVTSIGGTSRLLTKKVNDRYITNLLKVITDESNKIEEVLDDIASFVGDKKVNLAEHHLFPLIRKSLLIFYTSMKKYNILCSFEPCGLGPRLLIDQQKIHQLLLHLIRNSIDAMRENGGRLSIEVQIDSDVVAIEISDTGTGIPIESLPLIKNPFFTTKTYGNGMGLAIVEQIVLSHQGIFTLSDRPDGGTLTIVKLPAIAA